MMIATRKKHFEKGDGTTLPTLEMQIIPEPKNVKKSKAKKKDEYV